MISGILPIDKPLGWTSHDVVRRVRRVAGQRSVGHAGTLDPLATGVLVVVLGSATRLSSYLLASDKEYCAEVVLGATTATDDAEGDLLRCAPVRGLSRSDIERAVGGFVGDIDQVPPRYAAVKRGGQKLYVLARRGEDVDVEARRVTISRVEVVRVDLPRVRLRVTCGAGTYIRALARDLGAALGVGGYLHALRRVRSGQFVVSDCAPLDRLTSANEVRAAILPPERAVLALSARVLSTGEAEAVGYGRAVEAADVHGSIRLYDRDGRLLALGEAVGGSLKPTRVFRGDDEGRS
ncbi:MAG TPA: tRNA pseudouridine(55) synthase TruB [Chloroflexota bacterium]|nr:tRNA pseudouridine(55) synthase TruB [Chloroflexota bacterium]